MLCRLTLDLADVQSLLGDPQAPGTTYRLYRISAGLSVLLADELMVLGDTYAANAWYSTARNAAEQTGDRALHATVLTLSAILPLYWDRPTQAACLAHHARVVAGDTESMASTMAPGIEALALAQLGNKEASEETLAVSRDAFERSDRSQHTESIFGLSERRFRFYEGKTLSQLGYDQQAAAAFDQALTLYPTDVVGDPTLIRLEQAAGLIRGGDVPQGLNLADTTPTALPAEHRADIFLKVGHRC